MIKNKELLSKFTNALRSHDWFFDFSDDHSVWTRGRNEKESLVAMAKKLVADGMDSIEVANLWNEFAPSRFGAEPFQFEAPKFDKPQNKELSLLKKMSDLESDHPALTYIKQRKNIIR